MNRRAPLTSVAVAGVLVAGCSGSRASVAANVGCGSGRVDNQVLVLMAQAVPTAALLPCIQSVPVGWTQHELDVANGRATFVLGSDRDGPRALTVVLTRSCRLDGATQVPSDEAGARRYERPRRVSSGYAGDRYYVYPGGCTTYRFELTGAGRAVPISEIAQAVRFVPRSAVADLVRRMNGGQAPLDPTGTRKNR